MKVSIITPNYNGEALLKKNLPRIIEAAHFWEKEANGKAEIIVVDDGSEDGSKEFVRSKIPQVRLIENEKNLGFSSTVNRGVKESSGEIVVLLNTDVAPEKGFLTPLLRHFADEEVFAVGCLDKSIESGKIVLRGRGVGKWQRGFLVHSRGEVNKTNTLWVSGGSGAFRRSVWEKLGGFNEFYNPFYWEDIDLSYRALKSGYKLVFEPKSVVVHKHEEGIIKRKYSPFQIKTIAYRNQFIFVWENATDLILQFLHILWLPYYLLKAFLNRDWAFFLGFVKAFIILPKIIQSSFQAQKHFVKKDREVVSGFTS